jgi:hypothetical protein
VTLLLTLCFFSSSSSSLVAVDTMTFLAIPLPLFLLLLRFRDHYHYPIVFMIDSAALGRHAQICQGVGAITSVVVADRAGATTEACVLLFIVVSTLLVLSPAQPQHCCPVLK